MSLRTRLLIAIGVIAIVALAIADVVTYSSLESFLYQRIDQQLEQSHIQFESWVDSGRLLSCYAVSGPGPGACPVVVQVGVEPPVPEPEAIRSRRPSTSSRCRRWRY